MSEVLLTITGELNSEAFEAKIRAGASALFEEGERIMTDSRENYVPVDEAILKGSGHVQPPEITPDEITVTLAYGGAAAAYAEAVHEHLSEHSPRSWQVAEATGDGVHFSPAGHGPKYLERPLLAASDGMASRIADDIKQQTGG